MANSLANIMPKILARGLMVLRTRCIMPRLVNGDYSTEAKKKGQTIDVPVPVPVPTQNVVPGTVPVATGDTTPGSVQIQLNNWKQNKPIYLTDNELVQIDRSQHFLPLQLTEAVQGLASDVNQSIFAKYKGTLRGIFSATGTPGTTPFASAVTDATNARKNLNKQRCPRVNRRGVLDFDAEGNALALSPFSDAEKIMSAVVKMEGEIGRKYGIDWAADDDVPFHTAGTAKTLTGTLTISDEDIGDTTIVTVTSNNAADDGKTIVQGDIITIAGDTQTYVVVGAGPYTLTGTSGSQTISNLQIYPGLRFEPSGGEALTVAGSHRVNMAFHRDAFAFATRPLVDNTIDLSLGSQILSMQDEDTGLVMRLEVSRQHKQVAWEFDILWGCELVRPELATRIYG
jgi:hypothetical protein